VSSAPANRPSRSQGRGPAGSCAAPPAHPAGTPRRSRPAPPATAAPEWSDVAAPAAPRRSRSAGRCAPSPGQGTTRRAEAGDDRTLTCGFMVVELRGFEPLTPCMPCHPRQFTRPSAASLGTTSALLSEVAGQGAVLRHEATCGIAADNLLTDWEALHRGTGPHENRIAGQGPRAAHRRRTRGGAQAAGSDRLRPVIRE
jgi:hypothetical protein